MEKTIAEILELYPGLEARVWEEGVDVGFPQPGDLFNVQGCGDTPEEAYQEAYYFLTSTGPYSKEFADSANFKLSIDRTVEGNFWLNIVDEKRSTVLELTDKQASYLSSNLMLKFNEYPF